VLSDARLHRKVLPEEATAEVKSNAWLCTAPEEAQPFEQSARCTVQKAVSNIRHFQHHYDRIDKDSCSNPCWRIFKNPDSRPCTKRVAYNHTASPNTTATLLQTVRSSIDSVNNSLSTGPSIKIQAL